MTISRPQLALVLVAVFLTFATLSNTVGDGNAFGGVAFFVWALAVLGLLTLGVRAVLDRRG